MNKKTILFDLNIDYPPLPVNSSTWTKFKNKCLRQILINENHPLTVEYFRGEVAILHEKKRHYEHFKCIVHPLSKFNQIYDVWCFFFYAILMIFKTFDFAFIRINEAYPLRDFPAAIAILLVLDFLSMINICFQFFIGYCIPATRTVELSKIQIAKRYFLSGHLICDILSSFPRITTYKASNTTYLVVLTLTLLRLRRITTFINLIKPVAQFFHVRSNTAIFLFGFFFNVFLIMHVTTCLHVGIPRYRSAVVRNYPNESWANREFLLSPVSIEYISTFFRSAQYTLLIHLPHVKESLIEEVILDLLNYFLGKCLLTIIWIVLLNVFLSQRTLRTKFEEVMTELKEYLEAKQLPHDLQRKLIAFYKYKYQNVFFNEHVITNVLSEKLKREIDVYLCKSLIKQVSIFSQMETKVVQQIISHLVPEIYLPNDIIIQSGTLGECMYFIESGTVAVFSPSGKEICHLLDGAYFGEFAVLLSDQRRTASILAIEYTRLYKLSKVHFDKYFEKSSAIFKVLIETAEERRQQNKIMDEQYKKWLFEQTYKM